MYRVVPLPPTTTTTTAMVTFSDKTITTTVTADSSEVSNWISNVRFLNRHPHRFRTLTVGLDIEWRPSFIPNHQDPVATVQICVGRRCLIYQIIHIPRSLTDFLSSDIFTFVGRPDLRSKGLKDLAMIVLGRNIEKPRRVTLSDWENRRLTEEQVHYACVDAYVSYKMGKVLHAAALLNVRGVISYNI